MQQIEIARDDNRLLAGFFGLTRKRRNHVVGFLAFHFDDRNVVHVENLAHERELAAQIVGHGVALRFVIAVQLDARGRHAFIERGDDVRRFFVGDDLVQHHRKAVHGVDRHAFGRGQRAEAQRTHGTPSRTYRAASSAQRLL